MARCLGKQAGLARLTSEERWKCQPLKTSTGWIVSNFSPLCTGALSKLCPGDTEMPSTIPNPTGTVLIGGPGAGSFPTMPGPRRRSGFEQTPTGTQSTANGGGPPDALCALAGLGGSCTWLDLINAGIDVFGGGDGTEEPPGGDQVPGTGLNVPTGGNGAAGTCPDGAIRIGDKCVAPGDIFPGGAPFVSAADWQPVRGLHGAGFAPMMETRQVRQCPKGFVLGDDNVCYDHLPRSRRKWDPGMKPLLTGGDRAAIRKAATAARKLKRAKKQLKKSARALEKVS